MLKQLIEEIRLSHPDAKILHIDKELEEFSGLRSSEDLHVYFKDHLLEG